LSRLRSATPRQGVEGGNIFQPPGKNVPPDIAVVSLRCPDGWAIAVHVDIGTQS